MREKKKSDEQKVKNEPVEDPHYVRGATRRSLGVDILDYQDKILIQIQRKTRHKKRNVVIAILDFFFVTQRRWLDELKIERPADLDKMTWQELARRFGYPLIGPDVEEDKVAGTNDGEEPE